MIRELFPTGTTFYNFSGGMESAAMLVLDRERIREREAVVVWADTGKQFPEMQASIAQIESATGLQISTASRRISFEEFLFERGGMLRKGTTDCSRRMKRSNLSRFRQQYPYPHEINLGFNADEGKRADEFVELNERPGKRTWRFPLIEAGIDRDGTWEICRKAGFTILVGMYEKMGRFDCYFCPNQSPSQAKKVIEHYPELAAEWMEWEERKGHSFKTVPLKVLATLMPCETRGDGCSCFGGADDFDEDEVSDDPETASA